jgi:hypothetical protein
MEEIINKDKDLKLKNRLRVKSEGKLLYLETKSIFSNLLFSKSISLA